MECVVSKVRKHANKASPTLGHMVQADMRTLAVNGQLNSHHLPNHMDLSIHTKD
jgi:hypothetical protein